MSGQVPDGIILCITSFGQRCDAGMAHAQHLHLPDNAIFPIYTTIPHSQPSEEGAAAALLFTRIITSFLLVIWSLLDLLLYPTVIVIYRKVTHSFLHSTLSQDPNKPWQATSRIKHFTFSTLPALTHTQALIYTDMGSKPHAANFWSRPWANQQTPQGTLPLFIKIILLMVTVS